MKVTNPTKTGVTVEAKVDEGTLRVDLVESGGDLYVHITTDPEWNEHYVTVVMDGVPMELVPRLDVF